MRVGIYSRDFVEWAGGLDLLKLISTVIVIRRDDLGFDPIVLVPLSQCRSPAHPEYAFSRDEIDKFFNGINLSPRLVFYNEDEINLIIKDMKIDVLLPVHTPPKRDIRLPWVGYIYDFQHRYIPEHYTIEECKRRDRLFAGILSKTRSIVVNSQAVKRDVERFFPDMPGKTYVMPFCPVTEDAWCSTCSSVSRKYDLPDKYFCICNQFWVHKEHRTAFRALAKFTRERGRSDVGLVCTGRMRDRRFISEAYIESLQAELLDLNISTQVHLLGHIPKKDQMAILKSAEALIQPTLFEGGPGGGAVYDATALGVPCIISDIPVNREVDAYNISYFPPGSQDQLSQKMHEILAVPPQRPTVDQLKNQQEERMALFARCIGAAVKGVLE